MTEPIDRNLANVSAQEPRARRFRGVPLRLLIPNLVTLLALSLGLTAIRFATIFPLFAPVTPSRCTCASSKVRASAFRCSRAS